MTDDNPTVRSPFTECLILVTISGRSLQCNEHQHLHNGPRDTPLDEYEQHRLLDSILATRLRVLSHCYPSPTEAYDPLLLFANVLGQAVVIYHFKGSMEPVLNPKSIEEEDSFEIIESQNRVFVATETIVHLATALLELHFSKVKETPGDQDEGHPTIVC